jgi:hypothetical protein
MNCRWPSIVFLPDEYGIVEGKDPVHIIKANGE